MKKLLVFSVGMCVLVTMVAAYWVMQPDRVRVELGGPMARLEGVTDARSLQLSNAVDALAFTPSGDELVVLTKSRESDNARHVLRTQIDGSGSVELHSTFDVLIGLALSPKGDHAYTGVWRVGADKLGGLLKIDALAGGVDQRIPSAPLDGFGFAITSDIVTMGISADGTRVAAGSKLVDDEYVAGGHIGSEISVWDTDMGEVLWRNRTVHTDIIRSVVFSPDGERLYSAGEDSLIRVWDAQSGELERTLVGALWDGAASMDISPDGRYLVTGGQGREDGGRVRVWDLSEGKPIRLFTPFQRESIVSVTFCADGTLVAAGTAKTGTAETPLFELHT